VSPAAIFPVHGQMIELRTTLTDAPVVYGGGGYLVARGDGRVVVGSTMEQRGFDKQLTVGGLHKVLTTATTLLPALSAAAVTSTWAGLRPATPDGLPLLGRSQTGVWVASGHFRNGILLAAISAERIAAAVVDDVAIDDAFRPGRFGT
jgi:glycine oxidase